MTNREEFGTDYQERMERAQSSWWVSSMHELGRQLLKAIPPDARVLDIGCGTGATLRWLAPHARESVGVDVSIEGLAVARETAPGSRLAVASASALPFADKTMDIVVSTDVLQHLRTEDRQAALREMHRVLVPGGRILVRTNAKSLRKGVAERADWQLIRGSVLRREAEDAGLVCERMTHANAAGAVASALGELRSRSRLGDVRHDDGHSHHHDHHALDGHHHGLGIPKPRSPLIERLGATVAAAERCVIVRAGRDLPIGHTLYLVGTRPRTATA